jgi:hypothetical protein
MGNLIFEDADILTIKFEVQMHAIFTQIGF